MKVNIGDRVRFLNEIGEGKVMSVSKKNIAQILTTDGFEIPMQLDQLVVVQSAADSPKKSDTGKNIQIETEAPVKEEIYEIEGNDYPRAYFAMVLAETSAAESKIFDLYIVNDSNYFAFSLILSSDSLGDYKHVSDINIFPNTKEKILTCDISKLQSIDSFLFQVLFFKRTIFKPEPAVETRYRISPARLYKDGAFAENDFFDSGAIIFELSNSLHSSVKNEEPDKIEKVIREKALSEEALGGLAFKYKAQQEEKPEEVDLHINHLLVDCRGMSNQEILDYQMAEFHKKLKEAIEKRSGKIIFIHGIGNGTLKNTLRKSLETEYEKLKYQDASFREYGFGATLVLIPKNL